MERPSKRMRISNPEVRNPRDTGSMMTGGLFTSELGIRSHDSDGKPKATRTISLTDFQRKNIYGEYQRVPRPVLPRKNAGIYLMPRAPDATVTANVVQVNVNDGTSTSKATEVPAGTVVSLPDVGSLTIPGVTASASVSESTTTPDRSQETITTAPTTSSIPGDAGATTDPSLTTSTLSPASNSTIPISDTTTLQQNTVTVTATSTFEVSFVNGVVIAGGSTAIVSNIQTSTVHVTESPSTTETSATYTFGQLLPTSSSSGSGSTTADSTGISSDYFTAAGGVGATGSQTTSAGSTETSGAGSGSGSNSGSGSGGGGSGLSPTQQQVVGGVVGGVAGVAIFLAILLVLLRWYRRRLKAQGQLPEQRAARGLTGPSGPPGDSYAMSQRSSIVPLAAAVSNNLKRLRPHSNQTFATTATGATESSARDSERGFQRIAGRKIPSVLSSGGDPYGGNYGAFEKDAHAGPSDPLHNPERGLSGASFYRDGDGFYGGRGSHSPTFPPSPTTATTGGKPGDGGYMSMPGMNMNAPNTRDFAESRDVLGQNTSQISLTSPSRPEGFAVMRPSPARTPVTLSPAASSIRLPIQPPPTLDEDAPPLPSGGGGIGGGLMPGPMHRDGVGRTLASQDASRVSRSSGRSGGRFMENM
ncbi:hypothetical protein ABEF93_001033 [Exophiala dermatitidis]